MRFEFPFGKAAFWIMMLAIVSGVILLGMTLNQEQQKRPDIVFCTFAKQHVESYQPVFARMLREQNLQVDMQIVEYVAIQQRLQAAMAVGAEVPDMVEIPTIGGFTRGPLEDVGFVDLTDRIKAAGLMDKLVQSRFSLWSSRGHIFALPHDVHPMVLVYRRDIVESLGIDVNKIETWDDFVKIGREVVTKDLNGDGTIDRYMLDLDAGGGDMIRPLLLQRGTGLFNKDGEVTFDSPEAVEVICWYVRQLTGKDRIAFSAGWGQTLAQCMNDGLVLFYFAPDWRTGNFQQEVPNLAGKLALMPLPAWKKGGRRVSTWGGTGLTITKSCKDVDRAWNLAMKMYYDEKELGQRFKATNIISPLKTAWNLPELKEPRPFYSNQPIGEIFAKLAPDTPADYVTPFSENAKAKCNEAYANIKLYYEKNGDNGLEDFARKELKRCADHIRQVMARNAFYATQESK